MATTQRRSTRGRGRSVRPKRNQNIKLELTAEAIVLRPHVSLGGHFAACLDAVRAGMAKHDHHLASFYILKKGTGTDDDPMCYLIPFNRVSMAVSKKLTELWKLDLVKAITASLVEWANDPEIIACSRTGELMVVAVDENGPLWKPTVLGELR